MLRNDKILIGVSAFGVICLIALLITLFTVFKKDRNDYEEIIKSKDETIEAVIRERDTYRQWKDAIVVELEKRDSALKIKYQNTVIKYDKVVNYITSLDREGLRAAITNY